MKDIKIFDNFLNDFQARYTYQSIIDNYEGDDLKKIAEEKISAMDQAEEKSEN